jgi:hypothetical protein
MEKNKKFIIESVREAMIKEELAIPLYVSHIEQAFFWSGLPEKKQTKIIESLKILERESEIHAKNLQRVLEIYTNL